MKAVPLFFASLLCRLSLFAVADARAKSSSFDFVDPLIGTINGGHVFPGASLPFGMAKAVADVDGENQGGFSSDDGDPITGFSHMHDSGTGGSPSLGNFPLFPFAGCPNDDVAQCTLSKADRAASRIPGSVEAHPGYFALSLDTSIRAEMTVSNHTGLYRFTFPATPTEPNASLRPLILAELSDLPNSRSAGAITVDESTGRIAGNATFNPSFGLGNYVLHFCADFSGANVRETNVYSLESEQSPTGAYVSFDAPESNNQILARVGVSFISVGQACSNAENEIPDFGFRTTRKAAKDAWNRKLDVVQINAGGASEELQTVFWSGIYRSLLSPQDYTNENPLWSSSEPYYDSYYCIWDSYRSIHPLITLLDPESQTLMVRSLIDIYRHEGWLPDCRMSLCKGYTQGGSNADVVLADAYLKGISDGVDWATAYEAVVTDAESEPENWDVEGRGGLVSWKKLGYIPKNDTDRKGDGLRTRSVSRTLEYAYNDFCIAEMARDLGSSGDYDKYMRRARNWKNVYKANQKSSLPSGEDTGFTGFVQPRKRDGTWAYQDPVFCSPLLEFDACYLNPTGHETYEGSAWLYTFYVPQDMANLTTTLGGAERFVARLDYLHESGILYVGDEQAFLNVFLYHYAGRPGLSAKRAHYYIPSQFNTTLSGIPGNDDSGAMGSFAALTMMGIFPNPGQDVYFITPPFFESVSIRSGQTGKVATIRNVNFDAGYTNIYIQQATLNGKPYSRNWLTHSFFLDGGVLELTLGSAESYWGTADQDLPPSLSTRA